MDHRQTAANVVYGQFQPMPPGLNLKFGVAVDQAAALVAANKHKVAAEQVLMHVKLFV